MSGTARRLFLGFSLLVLAFAGASWSALRAMAALTDAVRGVGARESNVRAALMLSSAVRDQYAHIAHSLLLGNLSHRALYERSRKHVDALLLDLERREQPRGATDQLQRIRARTTEVDALFSGKILPALARGDRDAAVAVHGDILGLVGQIQDDAEALAAAYEEDIRAYESQAERTQRSAFWLNLALLAGSVAVAIGVGVWIGRAISRPVGLLAAGAQRLEAGELGAQIPEVPRGSVDELRKLAGEFNRMSRALKEQQQRLVQQEKLASVGRLAAGVAHEINNPVGVIQGYVKLMQKRADPALQEDLRVVAEEAARCGEIVQGLLDLSRPPKLNLGRVRLAELAEEVAARVAEDERVPHAAVEIEGDATAEADANRVRQIVENLLRNAAQAAGAQGHVRVAISQDAGLPRLVVRDDGPGISTEIAARLFEPFATGRPGGTGLGLAVSRALAEAQGGTLQGANVEHGAEFTLTLRGAP